MITGYEHHRNRNSEPQTLPMINVPAPIAVEQKPSKEKAIPGHDRQQQNKKTCTANPDAMVTILYGIGETLSRMIHPRHWHRPRGC